MFSLCGECNEEENSELISFRFGSDIMINE